MVDEPVSGLIDGIVKLTTVLMPFIMLLGGYWITRQNQQQAEVALKLAAERAAADSERDKKVEAISKVGEATHLLVNSHYESSLEETLLARQSALDSKREILALTEDAEAKAKAQEAVSAAQANVEEAEMKLAVHMAKQDIVDERPPIPMPAPDASKT